MTTTSYPASPAQERFIADLLAKRDVPPVLAGHIADTRATMTSRQASAFIDLLKTKPYVRPVVTTPSFVPNDAAAEEYAQALNAVPNGRYAMRTSALMYAFPSANLTGDLLFVEVKSYKGTRYLRRLTGGGDDGAFIRTKMSVQTNLGLLKILAIDPIPFMKAFGENFSCCGRCGKSLTDPISRAAYLGPECRSALGL